MSAPLSHTVNVTSKTLCAKLEKRKSTVSTHDEAVNIHFDDFTVKHSKTNVVQAVDYYPFGAVASSYTRTAADPTKYLYNAGSELNDLTGYYETFFRNYDATIGRFNGVDIAVGKYKSQTPYNYAFNDPVALNDPTGADPYGNDWSRDFDGRGQGGSNCLECGYSFGNGGGYYDRKGFTADDVFFNDRGEWTNNLAGSGGRSGEMFHESSYANFDLNSWVMQGAYRSAYQRDRDWAFANLGERLRAGDAYAFYQYGQMYGNQVQFIEDFYNNSIKPLQDAERARIQKSRNDFLASISGMGLLGSNGLSELIDLSSLSSGRQIADFLNEWAKQKRADARTQRPLLHEFIDINTTFGDVDEEIGKATGFGSRLDGFSGRRKIFGKWFKIKILPRISNFDGDYDETTKANQIGKFFWRPKHVNDGIEYNFGYGSRLGGNLIKFSIRNNEELARQLHNYIIGH